MTLTIDKILWYTMRLVVLLALNIVVGCGSAPIECPDGQCDPGPEEPTMPPNTNQNSWSQSGKITPGSETDFVRLQARFPGSGAYILQFEIADSNNYGLGERAALEAVITWSVHGNNVRRVVDCKNGISIQGNAEAIDVKVYDNSRLIGAAVRNPIEVSMQVVAGTRPAVEQPPTLSQAPTFLPAGPSNDFIEIPRNAGIINFFIMVSHPVLGVVIPPNSIKAFQTNTGGTQLAFVEVAPDCCPEWVPLVNGATHILIEAGGTAPSTVWAIVWGIDG